MKLEEKDMESFKSDLLVTEYKQVGEVHWAAISNRLGSLYQPNISGFTAFLGFISSCYNTEYYINIIMKEEIQYFIKKQNKIKLNNNKNSPNLTTPFHTHRHFPSRKHS